MLSDLGAEHVYLACGPTDMRKSIDGLAALVQVRFQLDPFGSNWFAFCNRDRDKLKILRWDNNGFWLYYRRLEKGRFKWPAAVSSLSTNSNLCVVSRRQLQWLLDGLKLEQKAAHPSVHLKKVV
jgi:transposase